MAKKKKKKKELTPEDLLGDLNQQIPEGDEEKKKDTRPTLSTEQEKMVEFASLSAISKIVEARKKVAGDELKEHLWQKITDKWFEAGSKPSNPKVEIKRGKSVDCSCIFQVRSNMKVICPQDHPSARGAVTEAMVKVGFKPEVAEKIYDENVEVEVKNSVRPFNELVFGTWITGKNGKELKKATDVERSAATKLMAAIQNKPAEDFTGEEQSVLLTKETKYVVVGGFLDRAPTYCEDADQLRKLLTVLVPGMALSHVKFAQSDNEAVQVKRALKAFAALLGVEVAIVLDDDEKEAA
jgi:hypothetical protein